MGAALPVPHRGSGRTSRTSRTSRTARRIEFERFVERAYPTLLGEAAVLVDDVARAKQAVRAALVASWKGWETVRGLDDPVDDVRHRMLDKLSRAPRRFVPRRPSGLPRPRPTRRGIGTLAALQSLPTVQSRALVLHHMMGLTPEQIAVREHAPAETIRRRLAHGAYALAHNHPDTPTVPIGAGGTPASGPGPTPTARKGTSRR